MRTITEKIDAITLIKPEAMKAAPPAPRSVKIELTGRCNYRCGFCALRTREQQPTGDMDFELFKRITVDMRAAGVEEIGLFFLGESFMNAELLEDAIRWCKRELAYPYLFLTSNASMATPEAVDRCMEAGLDSLKWSVNACDDAQFADVCGVKPALFHRALENIKAVFEMRSRRNHRCGLFASSIKYDGEQQWKMEKLLDAHVRPYVDQHYWLPLYGSMTHWNETGNELGYKPTAGNQGRIGALRQPLPCWTVFTEGHVTSDGMLTACCFDSDGRYRMADLKTTRFMDAWHSPKFCDLRAAHLKKNVQGTICQECLAWQ